MQQPHRRRFLRQIGASVVLAALAVMSGLAVQRQPSPPALNLAAAIAQRQNFRVIDGDTLHETTADVRYRIANIDTPEAGPRAHCPAERDAARRATQTVRTLLRAAQQVETRPVGRTDRYGRTVAFVLVDGRDLGQLLITQGLARPWRGRREPWCGANGQLLPAD